MSIRISFSGLKRKTLRREVFRFEVAKSSKVTRGLNEGVEDSHADVKRINFLNVSIVSVDNGNKVSSVLALVKKVRE